MSDEIEPLVEGLIRAISGDNAPSIHPRPGGAPPGSARPDDSPNLLDGWSCTMLDIYRPKVELQPHPRREAWARRAGEIPFPGVFGSAVLSIRTHGGWGWAGFSIPPLHPTKAGG
jgi:hypothetical protein